MKKFNVGLQLYSVRESMARDFEGTLRAVAEMGYGYVEFAGYFGKSGEEIKNLLDKYGLKCVSVHQSIDFFDEDPEEKIAFLKTFGVKYNVIPWWDKSNYSDEEALARTARKFTDAATFLARHGMKLGYHNHDFEFAPLGDKTAHDKLFAAVPADLFDPEFDTCWVRYAGYSPVEKILEYRGRVALVHLKDFVCKAQAAGPVYDLIDKDGKSMGNASREERGFEFRPLGRGCQDFAAILRACEEAGTETVIVEQDAPSMGLSDLECAAASREYLKNTFGI